MSELTRAEKSGLSVAEKMRADRFAARPSDVAEELLEPVLSFFQQTGISEAEALKAFRSAWRSSKKRKTEPVSLQSLEDPQPYIDLVATWSRSSAYLDKDGLPRELPVRGKNGFALMVKRVAPQLGSKKALLVLHKYGNVERLANGKFRLTKPFFHIKSNSQLAFEPSVRFLLDAAQNVKASLKQTQTVSRQSPREHSFWRAVDSTGLPASRRKAYLAFVRALSLTFLQDVDDWLSENASQSPRKSRSKPTRVGLGLFTIGAAPE